MCGETAWGGLADALPGQVKNNLGGRLRGDGLVTPLEPVNNLLLEEYSAKIGEANKKKLICFLILFP